MKFYLAAMLAVFGCTKHVADKPHINMRISYQECMNIVLSVNHIELIEGMNVYYSSTNVSYNMAEAYLSHQILSCMRGN